MEIDMHPLNLHKANLELMLRILNLSQDFRHRGLEAACRYHEDVIAKTRAEVGRVRSNANPKLPSACRQIFLCNWLEPA